MENVIKVTIRGDIYEFPKGVTLREISRSLQDKFEYDIILAKVNGKLKELFKHVNKDSQVDFITTREKTGHLTYDRTATFILVKAAEDVIGRIN